MSYKLMQNIKDELDKIAEKGLNTGNLETAYKLIDMLKDMENVEYWKCKEEYYSTVQEQMEGGYSQAGEYSERRNRDSMGRYSRADGIMPEYDRGSSYARRGEHYVRGHYSRANGAGNAAAPGDRRGRAVLRRPRRAGGLSPAGTAGGPGRAHGRSDGRAG